jgi:hypothetical protein
MWIVQALQPAHGIIALVGHVRAQDVDEENMPEMFGHQCAAGSHLGQPARALAERPAQDGSKARTRHNQPFWGADGLRSRLSSRGRCTVGGAGKMRIVPP